MGLMGSHRQTFGGSWCTRRSATRVLELPWTFSTFDYRELCELLLAQSDGEFETAKVTGAPATRCTPTAATSRRR